MEPNLHLAWFEDNIDFFETITTDALDRTVPACPGWSLLDLLNHLSFGLGVCYPLAMAAPGDAVGSAVFAEVDRSSASAPVDAACGSFSRNMRGYLAAFAGTEPNTSCWTYPGPGEAGFWFRRAAVETTIHRFDAEEALGRQPHDLSSERLQDAIDETLEFALPFAMSIVGEPSMGLRLVDSDQACLGVIGDADRPVSLTGDGAALLQMLWGRETGPPEAAEWLSLIGRAFAGR